MTARDEVRQRFAKLTPKKKKMVLLLLGLMAEDGNMDRMNEYIADLGLTIEEDAPAVDMEVWGAAFEDSDTR